MSMDYAVSALLEIDVQNDFCPPYTGKGGTRRPGGSLAVRAGDEVVPVLNELSRRFAAGGGRVIATQDWHPAGHVSFAARHEGKKPGDAIDLPGTGAQVLWPDHCVQGTEGAAFHDDLDLNPVSFIIRKGWREGLDSYSAFFENDRRTITGLEGLLRGLGVKRLCLGGLATDYCVLYSALDAARLGFETFVLRDAVRAVHFPEGSEAAAFRRMEEAGVRLIDSPSLEPGAL